MEVSYRRELDHNYLVLEEKEFQENYQVNMLLKNRIPGFLECRMTRVDKKAFFYYEITSRQNLRLVLERKRLSLTEMIRLLEGLEQAAQTCEEYLLDGERILLHPDFIYLDPDEWKIWVCFYPFEKQELGSQLLGLAEYLLDHLGNYTDPSTCGLAYQMEYIYGGRDNDMDNLKSVAAKLLFIREGVNFACLMADIGKRAQAEALATAIAAGFLVPPAAVVIETALILCWAFAESVLDVRELFAGGRIPLVKTSDQWQISLVNLSELMSGLDTFRRSDDSGMSYEDYLQVLILTVPKGKKVLRSMDMIENSIRSQGRPHFCLDSCIVALEAFADVNAENRKDFQVIRQYAYE